MKAKTKTYLRIGAPIAIALLALIALGGSAKADNAAPVPAAPGVTTDDRTKRNIEKAHPKIRAAAYRFVGEARKQGINLVVTSSLRTFAEQTELYAQGRTKPGGKVTNAKAGQSYHNYGLALDVVELQDGKAIWEGDWAKIARIGKAAGFEWGGDFTSFVDRPHFQMRFGIHHTELLKRHNAGKMDRDGYVTI